MKSSESIAWLRRTSLAVKLTALAALVTTVVVLLALWVIRAETRSSTRRVFSDQLGRHQRVLLQLQRQNNAQLVSAVAIAAQSPALQSALAASRRAGGTEAQRAELLQALERELRRAVSRVDRELLLVTDERGRVFASATRTGPKPERGTDLSTLSAVTNALDAGTSGQGGAGEPAVYCDSIASYQVAVYPVAVNGEVIGALVLGERLGQALVASARQALAGEIVVTCGPAILASTLASSDSELADKVRAASQAGDSTRTFRVGGEEHVAASLDLGLTQDGKRVALWLLQPVGGTVRAVNGPLARNFAFYGLLAAIAAALGAGLLTRSVLRSFQGFVSYVNSSTAEHQQPRFDSKEAPAEVRALNASFEHHLEAIASNRDELQRRTTELTAANAVLLDEKRERERVEHALRDSEEQLRQAQKLEAIGTLAGGIAHDFNNLLTAVSGFTQLALMGSDPKSSVASDLRQVVEAADRAAHLTRQLLAFSRKQVLQPTVLDLEEVTRGVEPLLHRLLGARITLRIQSEPGVPRVIADRGQLEQVIINLAINARDAMPDGGVLSITASNRGRLSPGDPRVSLVVSDTGRGIPENIRDRIFEPFFTTKDPGKGTGLGLSTVYGIVKQSGGTIDVDTKVGVGTRFIIRLPAASESAVDGFAVEDDDTIPDGTETILIAEDDADVRALTRRMLEARGYTVLPACDAEEALQLAKNASVDVLLTDMVMPRMSGSELAGKFLSQYPGTVVIFMSGYADDALTSMSEMIGAAYLTKPFTAGKLARTVRDAIDGTQAHHKGRRSPVRV